MVSYREDLDDDLLAVWSTTSPGCWILSSVRGVCQTAKRAHKLGGVQPARRHGTDRATSCSGIIPGLQHRSATAGRRCLAGGAPSTWGLLNTIVGWQAGSGLTRVCDHGNVLVAGSNGNLGSFVVDDALRDPIGCCGPELHDR